MRARQWIGAVAAAAVVAAVAAVKAGSYTLIGNLVVVDNPATSNSATATIKTNWQAPVTGTFLLANGGLASTNALTLYMQVSIDSSNWVTVATYHPTLTNATTEAFHPVLSNLNVYLRAQAVVTNAVSVGGTYSD